MLLKIFFAIILQLFKVFNKLRLILRFSISVYYKLWNGPVHSLLSFQLSSLGVQWLRESEFIVNSGIFKYIILETLDTRNPLSHRDIGKHQRKKQVSCQRQKIMSPAPWNSEPLMGYRNGNNENSGKGGHSAG